VAEKALLAKRVPNILPTVLQLFKDNYQPPLSDQPFDTVLAGNALNAIVPEADSAPSFAKAAYSSMMMPMSMSMPPMMVGASNKVRMAKRSLGARAPMAASMEFSAELEDEGKNKNRNM
jgi:hypothetical protein